MKKLLLLFGFLAMSIGTYAQVPNYVPSNNLQAWYNFNGNADDDSGNANHGTVNGANSVDDRFSNANSAFNFDGINDNITLPSGDVTTINVTNDFTLSAWVKTTTDGYILACADNVNSSGGYHLGVESGTIKVYIGGQWYFLNITVDDNQWHHVAVTVESLVLTVYVDLAVDLSTNCSATTSYNGPRAIGSWSNAANYFAGIYDDIGIWDRALNFCELSELYNGQLTINNAVTQVGSLLTADQSGATYQWLDCDNNYAVINGETNQSYTPAITGNYAVEVTLNGCVDTSTCFLVDYTDIEELIQNEKELVKIVDFMGRETEYKPNTPLIFIYSDGSRERVMKIEE
jgi:hypothetical protein